MEDKPKTQITLVMPRSLYERLNEMRWERRAPSFTGLLRDLLEDCVDRFEKEHEAHPEMAQSEVTQ
ncbi:MAG: hypothetical protein OXB94_09025 [Nitrospira sp.]|nr:hypothetical protein [Nitrospira sp.]